MLSKIRSFVSTVYNRKAYGASGLFSLIVLAAAAIIGSFSDTRPWSSEPLSPANSWSTFAAVLFLGFWFTSLIWIFVGMLQGQRRKLELNVLSLIFFVLALWAVQFSTSLRAGTPGPIYQLALELGLWSTNFMLSVVVVDLIVGLWYLIHPPKYS